MRSSRNIRHTIKLAVFLMALLLAGCGTSAGGGVQDSATPSAAQTGEENGSASSTAGQTGEQDGSVQIGVAVYSLQNEYMKRFAASASAAAEEAGVSLKIYDGNYDAGLQVTQIEEMIESGVDGILLNPEDADECVACVDLAREAGVPVISVNTRVNSNEIASYVGSDDKEAGRLLMQRVAEALDGSGNVVILEGPIGQSAQRERLAGMKEVLQQYPGLRAISCKTANWSGLEARGVMEKWLGIFDRIDAVAAENDDMALGAVDAIAKADSFDVTVGDIVVVGIDGSGEAVRAVENGQMTATIFQNAEAQGETAVRVMSELLQGGNIETEYIIPFELIDRDGRTVIG